MIDHVKPVRRLSIVCCSEMRDPKWRWLEPALPNLNATFEFVSCPPAWGYRRINLARLIGAWRAVRVARKIDASVVVTHGPTLAMWCCLFASLFRLRGVIFAHSFNFTELPGPFKCRIFSLALKRAERFAVFSRMERALYAGTFGLDVSKIDFIHWGVNPPVVTPGALEAGNYICSIGGNARDYHTLMDAARLMPSDRFIVVARPHNMAGLDVPANVQVRTNLPLTETMNILGHSQLLALPLTGSEVPCGHVTIVAAMHLGKPVIITDSTGVADYVENGVTGLTVTMGSASELARAIQTVLDDSDLLSLLADNGKRFATTQCSERAVADHFGKWVISRFAAGSVSAAGTPSNEAAD